MNMQVQVKVHIPYQPQKALNELMKKTKETLDVTQTEIIELEEDVMVLEELKVIEKGIYLYFFKIRKFKKSRNKQNDYFYES